MARAAWARWERVFFWTAVEGAAGAGEGNRGAGEGQGYDADEAGGALVRGRVRELAEDAGVVEGVAFFARLGVLAAVVVVVAADDPGPAVEGVDLEAGVVGEAGEVGLFRVGEGLDGGVLGEGCAGLVGF
jgi:hypothetical protein